MRIVLLRRRWFNAALCLSAAAVMLWVVSNPGAIGAAAQTPALPVYRVAMPEGEKLAAITFDAAWEDTDTQALIQVLDAQEVKATFFVVGEWAQRCPESVKALHSAGHEIMNHSATHPHLSRCSREELMEQVQQCNEQIAALTGETPTLFRCPYGEYNDQIITTVRSLGMTPVQWSVDSLDYQGLSAQEITRRVVSRTTPGSILLFHNGAPHTPEALPNVITSLKNQGYRFVKLSELLIDGDYLLDSNGEQHPAEASSPAEAQSRSAEAEAASAQPEEGSAPQGAAKL